VTVGDVLGVLPFENNLFVVKLTGKQLKEELANDGPVVAGLTWKFREDAKKGRVVVSAADRLGRMIDDRKVYRVVINDFMYFGGDGFRFREHDADPEDSGLSLRGSAYAQRLAAFFNKHYPLGGERGEPVIWTSTLRRTQLTAAHLGRKIVAWKALDEIDAGVCDGMTYEAIAAKWPEEYAQRSRAKFTYRYPRGESYADIVLRLEPLMVELVRQIVFPGFFGKQGLTPASLPAHVAALVAQVRTLAEDQIRRALRPDGFFIGALFGSRTLQELRQALTAAEAEILGGVSPRVSPFLDIRDAGALLQRAGFTLPVADTDEITVHYKNPLRLFEDLRLMGETNVLHERQRRFLRRDVLLRALEIYRQENADGEGRIRATFEIMYLAGWAPHESQQQPLKPGSAKMKLADALKATSGKP
jgi:hypothetical protein